jgi:hypothetical protein
MLPQESFSAGRVLAASLLLLVPPGAATAGAGAKRVKLAGWDAAAVDRAREGAARRLEDPGCQQVFADFKDAEGRTLQHNLDEWGMNHADYLRMVPFIDGSRETLCRKTKTVLVSVPGVRRVMVCPAFADQQLREPRVVESMVIHEILHTLGLGENPPTSIEITQRVEARCR